MRLAQLFFSLLLVLTHVLLLAGCSGNDSYDDNNPDNSQTAKSLSLSVRLDGTQQVPQPVQSSATGTADININQETREIGGSVSVSNPSSTVTAVHIHQAVAGVNSSPIIPLEQNSTNTTIWNIPPGTTLTDGQLNWLLSGSMYINVHTSNHASGEIRGQITGPDIEVIRVILSGENEVPPVTSVGDGFAFLTLNKTTANLVIIAHVNNVIATDAHVHQAFAGINGAVILPLDQNLNDGFIWEANTTLSEAQLDALFNGEMYINIHTNDNSNGELRGQILIPSFEFIQNSVFKLSCASCHSGEGAAANLSLDSSETYERIVAKSSSQDPGLQLVSPGNPDNSYLIQKLEGTANFGSQMPVNGLPLQQVEIDNIRAWIAQGASIH